MNDLTTEERFIALFDTLPAIGDFSSQKTFKPNFDFGNELDCIAFLNDMRKRKQAGEEVNTYPLVWLETPIIETGQLPRLNIKPKIILATLTNANYSNRKRLDVTFKPTLLPLLDNVIKALNRSGFTKLINRDREQRTKYFNYGNENNENEVTDIWDAIKFECEIEMSDCAQRTVFYN